MPSASTGTVSRPRIERLLMPWFAAQLLPSSLPAIAPHESDDTLQIGWSSMVSMKTSRLSILLPSIAVLAVLSASAAPKSKWKVEVDKKSSIVTGTRDVFLSTTGLKSKALLVLGCRDGKLRLLLGETFKFQNGMSNALTKSELQRQLEVKGPQSEKYGYSFSVSPDNTWRSPLKFRLDGETEFFDGTVPLSWTSGIYTLILDEFAEKVVPRLRDGGSLFARLPYKEGAVDVTFALDGIDAAKGSARASGCPIP
jgi:hypothetical protein